MKRIIVIAVAAFLLLSVPEALEFATGRATFDATGIFIELTETLTLTGTIAAIALLIFEVQRIRQDRTTLANDLVQSRAENVKWRENAKTQMEGVRHAIDEQFDAWQFTAAESEIAALILKGCSHQQIAEIRRSSSSTVRQQAQSIYRKSGLENRSELAAYFLDAILYPPEDAPGNRTAPAPLKVVTTPGADGRAAQSPSASGNSQ
jgi:DNA-binding CsgD family transcriptional regulator